METFSPWIKHWFILHHCPHVLISFLPRINLLAHHFNHCLFPPSNPSRPLFHSPWDTHGWKTLTLMKAYYLLSSHLLSPLLHGGKFHKVIQDEFRKHTKTKAHIGSAFLQHLHGEASHVEEGFVLVEAPSPLLFLHIGLGWQQLY